MPVSASQTTDATRGIGEKLDVLIPFDRAEAQRAILHIAPDLSAITDEKITIRCDANIDHAVDRGEKLFQRGIIAALVLVTADETLTADG